MSELVKPPVCRLNNTKTLNSACTRPSPQRNAEARCPSTSMGRTTFSNASSPIEQSWEIVWTSRRRRLALKPICRRAGRFLSCLPIPKSRVFVDGGLGLQRPAFLVILLDARTLVVDVQGGDDPLGDHPAPKPARRPAGHAPVEDQLHLARPPEVEVLADHLFEEDPTRQRTVEHLGQRKLRVQDRHLIAVSCLRSLAE